MMTDSTHASAESCGDLVSIDWLAGAGEMGRLIRSMDWAATPLGPIATWPENLCTTVSLCLASNFPISIAWGPQRTQIYNDGYWPICGAKHPRSMGQDFKECWRSAWPAIGDAFERARAGETAFVENRRMFLDRHGYLEETFFTFSFSPIRNESGEVCGLFHPVTELTQQTLAERRLEVVRDVADWSSEGKTGALVCELITQALAEHPLDVPFALLYRLDANGRRAVLAGRAGLAAGTVASPMMVDLFAAQAQAWPFAEAARGRHAVPVNDVIDRFGPLDCGPYPESPHSAFVLPINVSDLPHPFGLLVAGVSPRRALDDRYRTFYLMLRDGVTNALINARAHEEERKRAEALAGLDRAKTAFFSKVSHEFRTPLTLMLGPVEELLETGTDGLPPPVRSQLEVVHRNSLRLLKLVNTMLDFSRIEAHRMRATYEAVDLAEWTAELASVFRAAIERAGMRLVVDCPPLPEPVHVDRDMWEKIVLNLLSNAFKFTLEGEIEVRLEGFDRHVRLTVRDTGVGIPESELPRVFERFHRVRESRGRTYEGTGIGLALVQELVSLHGGKVDVESVVDQGSSFSVTLPLGDGHLNPDHLRNPADPESTRTLADAFVQEALRWLPDADDGHGNAESERARAGRTAPDAATAATAPDPTAPQRPRIVWADDNADMRQYVNRLLSEKFDVEAVPDGQAALAAIRADPPDLVLSDIMMPNLDGFGLLRSLRADPVLRDIPVILLSARAGEEPRIEGMRAGADDYMIKPFGARELLVRVESHVRMARIRREGEAALRESEEKFRTLAEAAPAMVWTCRPDGYVTYINRRWVEYTGQSLEEYQGDGWSTTVHPEDLQRILDLWQRCTQTGEPYEGEVRYRRHDGEYRWHYFRGVPLRGDDGAIRAWYGTSLDVEEGKAVEKALRHSETRLAEETAALARLTDASSRLWRVRDMREGLDEMLDATIELLGADMGNLQILDADRGVLVIASQRGFEQEFLDFFREVSVGSDSSCGRALRAGARVIIEDIEAEPNERLRQIGRSAGYRAVQSTPLVSRDGTALGMLSTCHRSPHRPGEQDLRRLDLYARQAADFLERCQAEVALRDADRRKDEFLATLAHELRNPLAPLRSGLQVMHLARDDAATIEQARSMMQRQVEHLVRLVDDLLDLSRISGGRITLQKERLQLGAVVQQAVETNRPAIERAGHQLTLTVTAPPVHVDGDPVRLTQVFSNLINNAVKFSDPGGVIRVTLELHDEHAVVRVKDSGVGIPPAMLPRIFEMFTQVDRSLERAQGGLGIGLWLVRQLIDMHGGTVEAHSEGPGTGSHFDVRLPISAPLADEPAPARDDVQTAAAGRRILVVDDNPDAALSLALMLEFMGNRIHTAHDGLAAVDAAETFRPDVILLDIGMPRLNGYEAARRIREQPWGRDIVLVALTGWGGEDDVRRSLEAGFDFHMVKPVERAALERLMAGLDPPSA